MQKRFQNRAYCAAGLAAVAILAVLPFSYSEAQSYDIPLPASVCAEVARLPMADMKRSQRENARQCDTFEAADAWEQQYGQFKEGEILAGVVYE